MAALLPLSLLAQTAEKASSGIRVEATVEIAGYLARTRGLDSGDYTVEAIPEATGRLVFKITVSNPEKAAVNGERVVEIFVDSKTYAVVGENQVE
ncbi:hypothetical protein [Pseudoxanthomonas sacheonensis]|uniref:hypothetical protein n=1 Tax=Pseudoxanthomonas sacheonensis TaxID=443615 RepID=UPI0013D0158E|nr:hypothetical protein [Pseudoxanthomonas sacheonensis]KAF1706778.1 hypothetical protein CSC73_14280 [Pseudoxanthomonas sacheonensis]